LAGTEALPVEVAAVVSNHQDLRSLAEWHGVPFHYFPIRENRKREQEVERVDHTATPEDFAVTGSELESVVLNRAIKWHAERRVFVNGRRTVVLR
jgi:formyltetrahydrofolate hydrolase